MIYILSKYIYLVLIYLFIFYKIFWHNFSFCPKGTVLMGHFCPTGTDFNFVYYTININ